MATTKVTTGGITDATIATADIADDAITNAKIAAGAVGGAQLGSNAVSAAKIGSSEVTAAAIAAGAVGTAKIADNAVTAGKLASGVQTTINNNADNRVITGSGTANTLEAESNLTYGGGNLQLTTAANGQQLLLKSTGNFYNKLSFDANRTSAGDTLGFIDFSWDTDKVADIMGVAGSDTTNKDDGHIVFRTSASQGSITERMRIDSSGRVIIGSTSTIGNTYSNNLTVSEASGSAGIQIEGNNASNAYASIYFGDAGHRQKHYIESQLGTNGQLNIGTIGTGATRINNSGGTVARFDSDGIKFGSDTAAANALDDYEEGNYDISLTGSGGGTIDLQGTINNLRYTKIGRMVHVIGRIYINGSTNPSGTARMNLPFTAAANSNDQNGQGYSYVTRYNIYTPNSDWALIFEIEPNQSNGFFLWDKPSAAWDGVNAATELNQSAGYLGFDFTYTTA
tara:strand:- start:309 stop:1670 length:1362 start_codon:yes stop_codon:yes gene_type:complete